MGGRRTVWPVASGLARGAFSIALAYAFLVVLMTASAQQRVLAELAPKLDYSSALTRVGLAETVEASLAELRAVESKTLDEQQRRHEETAVARAAEWEVWQAFAPLAARLTEPGRCGPAGDSDHLTLWNHLQQCVSEGGQDARFAAQFESAARGERAPPVAYAALRQAMIAEQAVDASLARVRADIREAQGSLAETRSLQQAFGELKALEGSWLVGGGAFIGLPPSVMQIVVAFFAGAFGALLITLVLAVYPQSRLGSAGNGSYYARILLGGLISICVYVALAGGTAILGDSRPFETGQMNVMSFSTVGLLAGMFSDRVALWFSERADVFFARASEDAAPEEEAPRERRRAARPRRG